MRHERRISLVDRCLWSVRTERHVRRVTKLHQLVAEPRVDRPQRIDATADIFGPLVAGDGVGGEPRFSERRACLDTGEQA
jgi:hypothetical protein